MASNYGACAPVQPTKLFIYETTPHRTSVERHHAQSFDWAVDKNISVMLVKEIVEAINAKWREYVAKGYLVGGSIYQYITEHCHNLERCKLRLMTTALFHR